MIVYALLLAELAHFFSIASTVISFVLLVVSVVVAAFAGFSREQLKTVRENNADLIQRVGILESAEHRLTTELRAEKVARDADREAMTVQLEAAKNETVILREAFTYPEQLGEIQALVTHHHEEAKIWWATSSADLHSLVESLSELATILKGQQSP